MKRLKNSLFVKLIYGYIVFFIFILISIVLSLGVMYYFYLGTVRDGQVIMINYNEILDDDMNLMDNPSYFICSEAWLELLDVDGNVIDIKGDKKDTIINYSLTELNSIRTRKNNSYYADILKFDDSKGNTRYCLLKYSKNAVNFKAEITRDNKYISIMNEQGIRINGIIEMAVLIFLLLCTIDAILLSLWINGKIKRPLSYIENGFKEVSSGNFDVNLNFTAEKEFQIIEEKFNFMVDKLRESVTEKNKLEQSKKLMLLNLSHDIKTPLTTIKGYITALKEGYVSDEMKINSYYNTILFKTESINNLINQMFDLLKIENEVYNIDLDSVDFFEFLRETIAKYYSEIEEHNMELELNIPETECKKNINIDLMKRVIENLLSNAIKYSGENTKIIISSYNEEDKIYLIFQNNGKGIPNEIKETLFEPFVLGDSSRQSCGGNGLGLAIVKAIIEKHNGKIKYVDSDIGVRFEIII